jgi:hypothetical protein
MRGKMAQSVLAKRLDGLLDEERPGAPRTITDAKIEHVLTLTLEPLPGKPRTGVFARWRAAVG